MNLTIGVNHTLTQYCAGPRWTYQYILNTSGRQCQLYSVPSVKHKSQSLLRAKICMIQCIKDKTCIHRIIKHNTYCFHKEHIIQSPVCEMLVQSGSALEINHENSSFYRTLY